MEKFERIRELISLRGGHNLRILDIGCRRQGLKPFVERFGTYVGADLIQTGSVEYVGDFTKGIPVEDQRFDVTAALDVIEHTGDMTVALDEMMRVTRWYAIVVLPNHAHWSFRLRFLLTGRLSDKWDIGFPQSEDRHRWLTTREQSDAFLIGYATARGYHLVRPDSKLGLVSPVIEKTLGRLWPNFWNRNQLYILSRTESAPIVAADSRSGSQALQMPVS